MTSCGDRPEPVDEWEVLWLSTVARVSEASTPDITRQQCEDMVAYLREQRTVVTPVPLEDLRTPVDGWFSEAEGIFFDCDLADSRVEESLVTLEALEGEVESVLAVER